MHPTPWAYKSLVLKAQKLLKYKFLLLLRIFKEKYKRMLPNESMFLFSVQKNTSWDLCPNVIICGWNDRGNFSKTGDHTVSKECPCDSLITVASPCNTLSENKKENTCFHSQKYFYPKTRRSSVLYEIQTVKSRCLVLGTQTRAINECKEKTVTFVPSQIIFWTWQKFLTTAMKS